MPGIRAEHGGRTLQVDKDTGIELHKATHAFLNWWLRYFFLHKDVFLLTFINRVAKRTAFLVKSPPRDRA